MKSFCRPRTFVRFVLFGLTSLLLANAVPFTSPGAYAQTGTTPLYGFTAFPYDTTAEAVDQTWTLTAENSTLYSIHFDKCVPWQEALSDAPFPAWIQQDWQNSTSRVPASHAVHISVTPTDKDRRSLAPACGNSEDGEGTLPQSWQSGGVGLDHPEVISAYLNYAKRVADFFQPRYLTSGIEINELSLRHSEEWPRFESLFGQVYDGLKAQHPTMQVGVEYILQSLMLSRVAEQVRPVVEKADYLGLSFYPYGSDFGVAFGAPALPTGVDQWRTPLAWVRQYTNKPLAIVETGYITQDVSIPQYNLHFRGDPATQAAYTRDLVQITKQDQYLFVVWFLAIDYDKLYAKMPPGSEVNLIWRNIGFFDGEVRPKLALDEWKAFGSGQAPGSLLPPAQVSATRVAESSSTQSSQPAGSAKRQASGVQVGFRSASDLFSCTPGDRMNLEATGPKQETAMHWDFQYGGDWQWCIKELQTGRVAGTEYVRFWIRSDKTGPVFVRLDEEGGESFYAILPITREWQSVSFELANLSLDADTRKDGRLTSDQISKITIADAAALDGVTGRRQIWLAELLFE